MQRTRMDGRRRQAERERRPQKSQQRKKPGHEGKTELSWWNDIWNISIQYMKFFIYYITFILHGLIRTHKRHLPKSLASNLSWLERGIGITRSRVQSQSKSWIFQASIRNCINCVHNYEDQSLLENYPGVTINLPILPNLSPTHSFTSSHWDAMDKNKCSVLFLSACLLRPSDHRENNSEPRVGQLAFSALVSLVADFFEVSSLFLIASSYHPFLSITSPWDDAKECVEKMLGNLWKVAVNFG